MSGMIQTVIKTAVVPLLKKLLGQHLKRWHLAVAMTIGTGIVTAVTNLGYLKPEWADQTLLLLGAVLTYNVAITSNTNGDKKKDTK